MSTPTLLDVARRAGVSKGTASKALNDVPGVSAATRARVVAAAEELGWTPSYAARALSRSSTGVVGLALARTPEVVGADSFFMAMVAGIEAELAATEHGLLMQLVPDAGAEAELLGRWAAERRVDGVVLLDPRRDDPRLAVLEATGMPGVTMSCEVLSPQLSTLLADEEGRMQVMLDHLLAAAVPHRHLVYLGGPAEFLHVEHRARRFRAACAEQGIGGTVLHSDYLQADVARWAHRLLALRASTGARAVLVDNELLAAQLLVELARTEVRVPEDLAILAFENSILCTVTSPPLTALHRNLPWAGRELAQMLLRRIDGPAEVVPSEIGVLRRRGSG